MPNKLLITSTTGGFDAQLEIDGRLSTITFFDCLTNPVITNASGSCPATGVPLVRICNDKGDKSVAVAEDCIVLNGTPVDTEDIYTIIEGICPNTSSTEDLATETSLVGLTNAVISQKDGEFLFYTDPNDNNRKVVVIADLTNPNAPNYTYTYLDNNTPYTGDVNDLQVLSTNTTQATSQDIYALTDGESHTITANSVKYIDILILGSDTVADVVFENTTTNPDYNAFQMSESNGLVKYERYYTEYVNGTNPYQMIISSATTTGKVLIEVGLV